MQPVKCNQLEFLHGLGLHLVGRDDAPPTAVESNGSNLVVGVGVFHSRIRECLQVLVAGSPGIHQPSVCKRLLILVEKFVQLLGKIARANRLAKAVEGRIVLPAGLTDTVELVTGLEARQPFVPGEIMMVYPVRQAHFFSLQ